MIKHLLSKCRLLLLSSVGVERGIGDVKHQLRLGWVGIQQCRIKIIVPKDLPTGQIAASADYLSMSKRKLLEWCLGRRQSPWDGGVLSMEATMNGELGGRGTGRGDATECREGTGGG